MKTLLILSLLALSACGSNPTEQVCKNTSQVIEGTTTPQCTCTSNGQVIVFDHACTN